MSGAATDNPPHLERFTMAVGVRIYRQITIEHESPLVTPSVAQKRGSDGGGTAACRVGSGF